MKYVLLVMSFLMTEVWAHPASTEYVDSKVNDLKSGFETRFNGLKNDIATSKNEMKVIETQINQLPHITLHTLGEHYQGGVIFWLDDTLQHGLVVANKEVSDIVLTWQNGDSSEMTNAKSNGIHSGLINTQMIVTEETVDNPRGEFAALKALTFAVMSDGLTSCDIKTHDCIGGWYLPSIKELQLIDENLVNTGLLNLSGNYWSSNEYNSHKAYAYDFSTHAFLALDKDASIKARSIHSF